MLFLFCLRQESVVKLFEYYKQGDDSLRKFLAEINTQEIELSDDQFLENINTESEFQLLKNKDD